MTDFEFKALQVAQRFANPGVEPELYSGTLFLECNAATAALVESALIQALQCGVIVSKVGQEFSFDFV
jgi:hypothetical protein